LISDRSVLALNLRCSKLEPSKKFRWQKEFKMKRKKLFATALVLSGSIGLGCHSMNDQQARSSGASQQSMSSSGQQKSAGRISQGDMQKVEQALKTKGYDPGTIDGKADAKTQQALRDYQSKNKLDVTGTIDPTTAESLDVVIIFLPQ
jgi:hypothetical protein